MAGVLAVPLPQQYGGLAPVPQPAGVGCLCGLYLFHHLTAFLVHRISPRPRHSEGSSGEPLDKDIYGLSPEELANVPSAPGALDEALAALKEDHEFLLRGDVFTPDVIEKWIEYKTEAEINPVRLRPHPHEFMLYYDI